MEIQFMMINNNLMSMILIKGFRMELVEREVGKEKEKKIFRMKRKRMMIYHRMMMSNKKRRKKKKQPISRRINWIMIPKAM